MNRKRFYELLDDPSCIQSQDLRDLEQLIETYPFFQTAVILYSLGLKVHDSIHFESSLKKAAIYSRSRKLLRAKIRSVDALVVIESKSDNQPIKSYVDSGPDIELDEISKSDLTFEEIEPEFLLPHELEEMQRNGRFPSESNKLACDKSGRDGKSRIIQDFIEKKPAINISGDKFFSVERAIEYSEEEEDDELVSETLAKIHFEQGNYHKALSIYKKLSLLESEKSAYFADQIENIRKRLKS
ncbi:MAG: hypothetical protein ACEPOW_06710 [Bacteroidales bacterium]